MVKPAPYTLAFILAFTLFTTAVTAVESSFTNLDAWDILDYKGEAEIALKHDPTTPPGYGPEVLAIKADAVVGLLKGIHLKQGEIQLLYRELQPQEMDADGLLLFHGQFGTSLDEEHNAKIKRAHCWMENDNDSGLHFTRLNADEKETNLIQTAGVGLVNGEWNRTGWIWQKVRVNGSKVQGKYWPAHEPEPADWQLAIDDAGLSEGRVGFRIGSGDVHIAYFAAGETVPAVAAPAAYLFPEEEQLTKADAIPLTLFTNNETATDHRYTIQLSGEGGEILTQPLAISSDPGTAIRNLLLTTTPQEGSILPVQLAAPLSAGKYQVKLLEGDQVLSMAAFELLDVAGLRARFDAVRECAKQITEALSADTLSDTRVLRLRVVADAATAHYDFGVTLLDSGDLDAAEHALYIALEALDELRGYKGAWLQDIAPDLSLTIPPMPEAPALPVPEDPMIMVYSPQYLMRFGKPTINSQSWVMGEAYSLTIPWEVEGASPDRDFKITVEVCDPLKRRTVARSEQPFTVPTSQWVAGKTYFHTVPLSVLAEDAVERPATPTIADGWHIIIVSVRDAESNAPLLLDNKPIGWHGRPEEAFEAGRVYISSTPVELTYLALPHSAVKESRTESVTIQNLDSTAHEGQLLLSVTTETGRLLERIIKPVDLAAQAAKTVEFNWTPEYCGALSIEVAFIQDNSTKTLTEQPIQVIPPDSLHFEQVVRLDSQKNPNGSVQSLLQVTVRKPADAMMTVMVYADNTRIAEKTTRLNRLKLPVTPHFGYYDVEVEVNGIRTAQRIIGTSVLARNGVLLVNAEPFIVKGVNVHGMDAQSPARTRLQMELLKALGFNSWRGDYPSRWQTDMAYDMNTAYSALAPFSCIGTDELFPRIDGPKFTTCRELSRLFLERYVDSAGVLLWNAANEIGGDTTNFILSLYPVYKHLDPARRPVHYANLYGQDRWQGQDVMAVNYYFGRGERAADRHPIIQTSIDKGLSRGIPVIYTEFNSYYGSIHTTGAEAVRGLFGWGVEQGMSGGFFYMRFTDSSHPSVFDRGLNTHKVLDEALIETFADVSFALKEDGLGSTALVITNKRGCTLRNLRLDLALNNLPQSQQILSNLKPHESIQVVLVREDAMQSFELTGSLSFESHHGIRSNVPIRLVP